MARPQGFSNGFADGFGASQIRGYLALNVGFFPTYEDGDILSAVSWKQRKRHYGEQLCFAREPNRRIFGLNGHGFVPTTHVLKDWCEATYQFRYERLSATTAKVVRLSDSNEIEFESNTPFTQHDGREVHMDIPLFFQRRLISWQKENAQGIPLFSDDGNENTLICYAGRKSYAETNLDTAWTAIESKLGVFEKDIPPPTFSDHRKRLVISVDDFDDATARDLVSPLVDETDPDNPVTVKKRKNQIEWRGLRDVIEGDVLDKSNEVSIHQIRNHVRSEIVTSKSI